MEIIRGRMPKAIKGVIYGPEGIGKTTLASKWPEPLFIDTEGSTAHMDVARLPEPTSWTLLTQEVTYVRDHPECCRTLVIDTADWAEKLCIDDVCARNHWDSIETPGYGKGYVTIKESFGKLLNLCSEVVSRGVNVVLTAHAWMRKFEQPDELGAYDRWELKLSKQVAPLVKEWADLLLFLNYKTMVVNVDGQGAQKGKNKVQGGKRVMYTTHHACWDAKNRFGLPDELPMDYESIQAVIEPAKGAQPAPAPVSAPSPEPKAEPKPKKAAAKPPEPPKEPEPAAQPAPEKSPVSAFLSRPEKVPQALKDLMVKDNICEWQIQDAVSAKGYYPGNTLIENMDPEFIQGWLIAFWPKVVELIHSIAVEGVPFNE